MAYEKFEWKDGKAGGTPITADRLNHIETGIAQIELTPGPKGDKGATGATGPKGDTGPAGPKGDKGDTGAIGPKGDKGATGANGANGFPTESQWNDLVARVTALETAQ